MCQLNSTEAKHKTSTKQIEHKYKIHNTQTTQEMYTKIELFQQFNVFIKHINTVAHQVCKCCTSSRKAVFACCKEWAKVSNITSLRLIISSKEGQNLDPKNIN